MTLNQFETISESLRKSKGWHHAAPREADAPTSARNGVNVAGYLRTESGVGAAARGYVRALQALGVPLALADVSELQGNRSQDPTHSASDAVYPYDLNVVCADVELHFAIMSRLGDTFFKDRYNVGIWAWELPRFPAKWYDRFAFYDEIWVGTSFIADVLAPIAPVPIVRIPPVLTSQKQGSREDGRRRLGVSPETFVFLFIFDFHSHMQRKNPLAAIEAFKRAFAPTEPVHLAIKSVNGASDSAGLARMNELSSGYPISLHDGYWPASEVRDLMAACDAYVSLHRAEGTGLTISDAMALGMPVIATGWSGNMDFMTVSNSYPVGYELVEIRENVGPYQAGEVWAEPSVEDATAQMRRVYENRDEAQARGHAARRDIRRGYSVESVADLIRQRLDAIDIRRDFASFRQGMWGFYTGYRALGDRIRDVVSASLPPRATVIVASKGDEELMQFGDRVAWHYPQAPDGMYAGYYPADGAEAVEHLEKLHSMGGEFLLLPTTARWWLEHYAELRAHLERHARIVVDREDVCVIFDLQRTDAGGHDLVASPCLSDSYGDSSSVSGEPGGELDTTPSAQGGGQR